MTGNGKHSSFYNRATPTMQLLAKLAPFDNGLNMKTKTLLDVKKILDEDPRYAYDDDDQPNYYNDSNPQQKPRHINSKARESQISDVITHSSTPEYVDDHSQQEKLDAAAIGRSVRGQSLIGGQTAGDDAYRTTNQIQNSGGGLNISRKLNSKKMVGLQNPDQMISPITGKLVANYGDWRDKAAEKASYEKASINTKTPSTSGNDPIEKVKLTLAARGSNGILGMARLFRIMDDDDSKTLSITEFKKAMRDCSLMLQESELNYLFTLFDGDGNGTIDYGEFIYALRRPMNQRRKALVTLAFNIIDKDGSGTLEISDIYDVYDVTKHPEFISKKKSKDQILKEFLSAFIIGGMKEDGLISKENFEDYYANIGSSIESDDYFELMIRNAWHISGGTGLAANSANRRVLVTRADGSEYVEEIKNDLGLARGDKQGMMAKLSAQGVNANNINTFGSFNDTRAGTDNPYTGFARGLNQPNQASARLRRKSASHIRIRAKESDNSGEGFNMLMNK
jgi:Ca2+-binding EF-hand superfamily protein